MKMNKLSVKIAGLIVAVTATGLKLGSKGLVAKTPADVANILSGTNSKGDRRQIRKALHANGLRGLASAQITTSGKLLQKAA